MEIRFQGGEADEGLVNLHEGAESLSGIGRVADLVSHFVATGEVRYRAPYSGDLAYYISGTGSGSLRVLLRQLSHLRDEVQAARAKRKTEKLFNRVIRRGLGQEDAGDLRIEGDVISAGTVDALTEAATPALLRAHRWISNGDKTITVTGDDTRSIPLNENTKEYLESEEVTHRREAQDVSVAAVNVNSRNGRVFLEDLGRTVPYSVSRDANPRTLTMLSRYLVQYAERRRLRANYNPNVAVEFIRVSYPDGRLKRLIIFDCYPIADAA